MSVKIKICGLNDFENTKQIISLNPDFIGHVFYEKSKRYVKDPMPEFKQKVAVTVNAVLSLIQALYAKKFRIFQLHGDETAEFCIALKEKYQDIQIIKAFGVSEDFKFSALTDYQNTVDYFLFDTKSPQYGGSGKSFNWEVLKKYEFNIPYFLSGGINSDNFNQAVNLAKKDSRLFALDLNSGFEISPGIKDFNLLAACIPAY